VVVPALLVEAGGQGAPPFSPPDARPPPRPPLVALAVELHALVVGPLVLAPGDDALDATPAQPAPDPRVAVALVTRQLDRPAARPPAPAGDADLVHDPLELGALLPLPGGDLGRQRQAVAVADQVHLGAEPAARAAQRVVSRLALGQGFFRRPRRGPGGAGGGAVDGKQLGGDQTPLVEPQLPPLEDAAGA